MVAWRRRNRDPGPVPAWVATFTEADWAGDHADCAWPAHTLEWHCLNRWFTARERWFDDHPGHAALELQLFLDEIGAGPADDHGLA